MPSSAPCAQAINNHSPTAGPVQSSFPLHRAFIEKNVNTGCLSCTPIRLCFLILLDKLPLHDLQPTHFLLHIFQLIIQHKLLLFQILQSFLPALVVDLLPVILAATQDRCRLSVLAQFILILSFKAAALYLRQLLPCAVMLLVFLPLFIGFDPDTQYKGKIVVLLSLAFQVVYSVAYEYDPGKPLLL